MMCKVSAMLRFESKGMEGGRTQKYAERVLDLTMVNTRKRTREKREV